jgi:hypothetical protein
MTEIERDYLAWKERGNMPLPTRELTSHRVGGLNECVNVFVMDEPGSGGACHHYRVEPIVAADYERGTEGGAINPFDVKFQNGPISNYRDVNGCSNESLLAIVEDRLKGFQSGPYACRENALALTHIQDALHWLQHRTRERIQRGVEGTLQK